MDRENRYQTGCRLMHRILASRSGSIRKLYPTTPTAATAAPLYKPINKDERRTTHAHKKKERKEKTLSLPLSNDQRSSYTLTAITTLPPIVCILFCCCCCCCCRTRWCALRLDLYSPGDRKQRFNRTAATAVKKTPVIIIICKFLYRLNCCCMTKRRLNVTT